MLVRPLSKLGLQPSSKLKNQQSSVEMETFLTDICKGRTLLTLILCIWVPMEVMAQARNATVSSKRPSSLNFGALFTFNSAIGRSAKPAILAAIDEVNSDSSVLKGTKLKIIFHDTNCSGFLGTVEALQLIENDVVVASARNPLE
ncbi:hypothetical protein ACLB2K_058427 [Fragaria x ananassa]